MTVKRRVGLCDIPAEGGIIIPYLWCLLKTYYEHSGKKSDEWIWSDPWQFKDARSDEEIIEFYQSNPPSVFGFSVYVWNEQRIDRIAQQIKQNHPDCLIVYGGPQNNIKHNPNFFREHPWVDIVVPGDAYGEIVFTEILDLDSQDYSAIPYIYYSNTNKDVIWSTKPIDKRNFRWAPNVFEAQEEFLLPVIRDQKYYSLAETTRGCPYKCSYCDWGGGTYTKTVRKPFATILSELEWLSKNKCSYIGVTDANFGIFDIDVTVAEYIKEYKNKYGFPLLIHTESAKNHPERVAKITKLFAEAGLLETYLISIQSVNDEIKSNIDRIDIPFKKQLQIFKGLQTSINNLPIKLATIMGLPGATIQTHLTELNTVVEAGLPIPRPSTWMLLPESPAFDPEYRRKFKIVTLNKFNISHPWAIKKNFNPDANVQSMTEWHNPNVESVVECYSYSREDWIYMQMLSNMAKSLITSGGKSLFQYMKTKHRMKPSQLLTDLVDLVYSSYDGHQLGELTQFYKVLDYYKEWMYTDSVDVGIDHHKDFPLVFSPMQYTTWRTLMRPQGFYNLVARLLLSKYNDVKINDLCNFVSNNIIDLEYNPESGRTFTSEYNWLEYFNHQKRLVKKQKLYKFIDNEIDLSINRAHKINWQEYRSNLIDYEKQYFYLMCTNIDIERTNKTIEAI